MNTEELRKLQNYIKENNIEKDVLVEHIMHIDIDAPKKIKEYLESINNKFFKKTYDTYVELVHVTSVKVLSEDNVHAYIDRYRFNTRGGIYGNGIYLNCESNYEIYCSIEANNMYNNYKELTEEEYNEIVCKFKYLIQQAEAIFKQVK